jgi:hypothetical protein
MADAEMALEWHSSRAEPRSRGVPMPLTETAVRHAKAAPRAIKLFDERGLFLLVQPTGSRC